MPLLLAREQDGELEFAGPAIVKPRHMRGPNRPRSSRAMSIEGQLLKDLRRGKVQWLRLELRVRVQHLKARGMLRQQIKQKIVPGAGLRGTEAE